MNIKFIVIRCGYVEESTTSVLIYRTSFFDEASFLSYKEAITDLALDLYAKYYEKYLSVSENRYSKRFKECCRKALIADKNANFCSTCGQKISDKEFSAEEFTDFIKSLHSTTIDSYDASEYANGREFSWYPFRAKELIGTPKEEVIFIDQNAEWIILLALIEAKPELHIDHDDIYGSEDWESFKNGIHPI